MPNPYRDDQQTPPVINLPQLDPKAALNMLGMGQRPQASISPFQGGYSTMLSGASRPAYPDGVGYMFDQLSPFRQGQSGAGRYYDAVPQTTGARPNPFGFMQNPFNQMAAWQQRVSPFVRQGAGASGASGSTSMNNNGMSADEAKWAGIAAQLGLDWNTTKSTYMRSPRNPNFSPSTAISLQADDRAWGDAALKYGVLTGNPEHDAIVWRDHYNAGGNMEYDPLAGHNDAIAAYQANQAAMEQIANGTPQPPDWLK